METIYDFVVVGGGPGGYTAALYAARAGLTAVVLEPMAPGGQMAQTGRIDNYPGFADGVDGFELAGHFQRGAERFGVKTLADSAVRLDLRATPKRITTGFSGDLSARTVVIATGASPRLLGVPGEETFRGRGVSYCATCDGMFFRGRDVAVIGGGNGAASSALTLSKLCRTVYLIHRRAFLRADALEQRRLRQTPNIRFLLETQVSAFEGNTLLTGLRLRTREGGETMLPVSGAFVSIGSTPNTALLQGQLRLTPDGYLDADETTRTDVPGVFAVGDVRAKPLRQIVTAAADGAVAAKFAQEYLRQTDTAGV